MCSRRGSATRALAGIMLDIDDLKGINDRLGHIVGDDAISAAGKILHSAVDGKGKVCRYGGDEFIILMYINSQNEITDMIDTIKTQARLFNESEQKPYEINFSIGYSTYEIKHDSIDDFLKKVDASLYDDKKRKIRERLISDRRHDF
jgi:diguanylate cyclase (GGDEF)-like protein